MAGQVVFGLLVVVLFAAIQTVKAGRSPFE
jgi:hypothetical protein